MRSVVRNLAPKNTQEYLSMTGDQLKGSVEAQKLRHKRFWNMCSLAMWVGIWITVLSVPIIRGGALRTILFGTWRQLPPPEGVALPYREMRTNWRGDTWYINKTKMLCEPDDTQYNWYYVPRPMAKPVYLLHDDVEEINGTDMYNKTGELFPASAIWCGLLPGAYKGYWPNAAQIVIFTVYMSTGSTIQLAWQGVIGTWLASLNYWVMKLLLPWGARDCVCGHCLNWEANGRCMQQDAKVSRVDGDGRERHYEDEWLESPWVQAFLWINTFGFVAVFLCSRAAENTMKFGLSWHVYYMMKLMDPNRGIQKRAYVPGRFVPHLELDAEEMVVMITTIIGAVIAIIATLFPKPLRNTDRVDDDAEAITSSISLVWHKAIAYFCGGSQTTERFEIREHIEKISSTVSGVQGNLAASWWETFNLCSYGRIRVLYEKFDTMACDTNDFMHALETSILDEEFNRQHLDFCEKLYDPMKKLHETASELMTKCAECCRDGVIDDDETEEIENMRELVQQQQQVLLQAYNRACPTISLGLSNETIFCYALSLWARKVTDLAEEICVYDDQLENGCLSGAVNIVTNGLTLTFNPARICDKEHLNFAFRNWLSICLTFYLGYTLGGGEGSIFTKYSSTMSGSLALLISHFTGSAMQKNLQRLLGVSLGNVIPIIYLMFINGMPCDDPMRFWVHAFGTFTFTFAFTYMYYTSSQWSTVGCLIAAFGMNELLTACDPFKDWGYGGKYKEIGMITFAILIQMLIDTLFGGKSPRQMACGFVISIHESVEEGFEAAFSSDLDGLRAAHVKAKAALDSAQALASECDPKLQVVGGMATDFSYDTYLKVLSTLTLVLSDMAMVIKAEEVDHAQNAANTDDSDEEVSDPEAPASSGTLAILNGTKSMQVLKDDLMTTITRGLSTIRVVLEHDSEEAIQHEGLHQIAKATHERLQGREQLMAELSGLEGLRHDVAELTDDRRCKLNVIVRALRNTKAHICMIEELCIKASVK